MKPKPIWEKQIFFVGERAPRYLRLFPATTIQGVTEDGQIIPLSTGPMFILGKMVVMLGRKDVEGDVVLPADTLVVLIDAFTEALKALPKPN